MHIASAEATNQMVRAQGRGHASPLSLKGLAKLFWSLRNAYEQNLNSLFLTQYNA
jgi:hypothetical protein